MGATNSSSEPAQEDDGPWCTCKASTTREENACTLFESEDDEQSEDFERDLETGGARSERPCTSPKTEVTSPKTERLLSAITYREINEEAFQAEQPSLNALKSSEALDLEARACLEQIEQLVDSDYDIVAAASIMQKLRDRLSGTNAWIEIRSSPLYHRLQERFEYFLAVGKSCNDQGGDWFSVYDNEKENQSIHACFDPKDQTQIQYRVRAQINAPLTYVMAVANEIELLPTWNKLCEKQPITIGRRTAHYMVLNYQMSALGGMYKVDILSEVRRFSDPLGGFLAEYIVSAGKQHPCYREPGPGYKRPETEVKNIWVACGPNHTIMTQVGKLKLPFSVGKWLASTLGGVAGKFIIGGLVQNSLRSSEPGSAWQPLLQADQLGLYERLKSCVGSHASQQRCPAAQSRQDKSASNVKVSPFDLAKFFDEARFSLKSPAPKCFPQSVVKDGTSTDGTIGMNKPSSKALSENGTSITLAAAATLETPREPPPTSKITSNSALLRSDVAATHATDSAARTKSTRKSCRCCRRKT